MNPAASGYDELPPGTPSQNSDGTGEPPTSATTMTTGTPATGGGIVYSRPFHYQKRSNPGPRPTPTRLFKRTQSEQQFGQRPIFAALPMPTIQQKSSSLPLATTVKGVADKATAAGADTSPSTTRKRSPSIVDLGARVKDLGQSVKNAAEDELRYELIRFAARTTAHGIPMAAQATRWYAKWMWICISLLSMAIFIWSVLGVFEKFQRKEKIVSVQLRFDNVPFPAITVCNLNPFKKDQARRVHEISETLDAYHQAVIYSKHSDQYYDESPANRERRNIRGGHRYVQIEPVMSDCECLEGFDGAGRHDCAQLDSIPKDNVSLCICNYDRQDSTIWPCYSKASWTENWCPHCNDIGYCTLPNTNYSNNVPCICQKNVNYCLIRPERMKRMWEVRGNKIPDENSPFRADFLSQLKELGYENMTDEVAITTKTREKLVLTMASLHPEQRKSLSYGRSEFIKMCSFNGQQCNIANDFKLHADPAFGNCYTFNSDRTRPFVSSRAGPSYGLRLLVHINTSDYLPTTQAAGVRIVIHSQDEHPFPDAFGYSAPTNQLSSFGISLRKVNRLPIPHGECLMPWEPLPEGYIYGNYKYEPEGCYKSCYQHQIIKKCGCSDPRYPQPFVESKVCNSTDLLDRNCLMVESIKFTRAQQCHCKHPCIHDLYTTAFSSARLTSEAFKGAQFDSQSASMLEIYYEQMSHEVLTESESYLFVNFVSDVGGQAGLWLGASILTLFEVIVFIFRIFTIVCRRRFRRGTIDESRSFDLDEYVRADSLVPKQSNAMHKSASTLTSLSARASLMNSKVSAAKGYRNASITSLNDELKSAANNNINNNEAMAPDKKKSSFVRMQQVSFDNSYADDNGDDDSTPRAGSKSDSRKESKTSEQLAAEEENNKNNENHYEIL